MYALSSALVRAVNSSGIPSVESATVEDAIPCNTGPGRVVDETVLLNSVM